QVVVRGVAVDHVVGGGQRRAAARQQIGLGEVVYAKQVGDLDAVVAVVVGRVARNGVAVRLVEQANAVFGVVVRRVAGDRVVIRIIQVDAIRHVLCRRVARNRVV